MEKDKTYRIPTDRHEEMKRLSNEQQIADIRCKCANKRLNRAIDEGNDALAIAEYAELDRLAVMEADASETLWGKVRELFPELKDAKCFALNHRTMELEMNCHHGMPNMHNMAGAIMGAIFKKTEEGEAEDNEQ